MMPDRTPTAPAAGQTTPTQADRDTIRRLMAAVDEIEQPTSVRVDDPTVPSWRDGARIGTAPPVPQPGRPPMSQGATDASALMLSGGVASVLVGGAVSLVMFTSGHADPVVCGIVFGSPAALALAASRLLKRAKQVAEAAPPEIHNHYNGPVHQDQRTTQSRNTGVWVKNDNRQ